MTTVRNYNGPDAQMTELARIIHQQLVTDLPSFTDFSSRFNQSYVADFLAKIVAAEQVVTDNELLSQQVVKTENVLSAMERARLLYRKAKMYAELTFAASQPIVIQEFSRGYLEARQNQPKMIVFLETLHNALLRHQGQLKDPLKGGMPLSFLDEVEAIRTELLEKNVQQETFVNTRKTLSEERIKILNACYMNLIEINNIAQVIFEESPARRSIYTFFSTSNAPKKQVFTGSLAPNAFQVIHTLMQQATTFISFENKGVVPLLFDIVPLNTPLDSAAFAGNIIDLGGGAIVTQSMSWLNADLAEGEEAQLIVHNPSTTATGSYEVMINIE